MNINPGEFKKKIEIFKKGTEKNGNGFSTGDKVLVRKCRASFRRLSGNEKLSAGIDIADVNVRFLCRYTPVEITTKMFVEYEGDIYNIVFVNDYKDEHKYIEIHAKKG